MTRSYSFRTVTRRVPRMERPARDPSIELLAFTCFRLVPIRDGEPEEPPFDAVELVFPPNMMAALVRP
jgi:hypothetical protein